MPEQDHMDRLLSQVLSAPLPALSPDFDRQLARQLQTPRLNGQGRLALSLYAVLAIVASVWTMREASIAWGMAAAAAVVPLVVVAVVFRRYVRPPAFG